jgi:hypothetical protein
VQLPEETPWLLKVDDTDGPVDGLPGTVDRASAHQEVEQEGDRYKGKFEDVAEDPVIREITSEPAWRRE